MKRVAILLSLGIFLTVSCVENEPELQVSNVCFTPCRQNNLRSAKLPNKVDVKFTDEGVEITYRDFEVTCDFTTVNVTHTFVNGFLNITQQGSPNQANCVCYSDVSYTINGILQDEVNVIFINGKQVYCYNDKDENGEGNNKDGVYVAIYEYPSSSNSSVPKLWKDGFFTNLSNSTGRAYATSVYVFGNDVYLAGHKDAFIPYNNQTYLVSYAQLWKNGKELTIGSEYSQAISVFVANNNDVYAVGYEYVIQDESALKRAGFSPFEPEQDFVYKYQLPEKAPVVTKSSSLGAKRQGFATLWKNGEAQYLTDGSYLALAYSVYVTGNDVYVAGEEWNAQGKSVAKLWKNGNVQNLTDGSYSAGAKAVFVSGNDVYVAGYEQNAQSMSVAKVWKNGVAQNLTNGTTIHGSANDVYVSGNDVYVVGSEINITQQGSGHVAQLWKNGVPQNLPDDGSVTSQARSVCVSGNDVYVSGHGQQSNNACTVAKLWKNGVVQDITDGSKNGLAYSVFVK